MGSLVSPFSAVYYSVFNVLLATFNHEKALVEAFSVIANLRVDLCLILYLVHDVDVLVAVLVSAAVPAQRRVGEGLVVGEAGQPPEAAGAGRGAHAAGEEAVRGDELVSVPHRAGVHHRHLPANSTVYSRVYLIRIFRSEQRTLDNLLTSTSHHETEHVITLPIDMSTKSKKISNM